MNKKLRLNETSGFTLMEIVISVFLLGLLVVPMFQLLSDISFSIAKENIISDMDNRGRRVLEDIVFETRNVPNALYINIYSLDGSGNLVPRTTSGQTGTVIKFTHRSVQPGEAHNDNLWYRFYTDTSTGKKYVLKYRNIDGPNGQVPAQWRNYILMDRVNNFSISITNTAVESGRLYNEYSLTLDLTFGRTQRNKVDVHLSKDFIKYLNQ